MTLTRRDRSAMVLALDWIRVTPGRGGGPHMATANACEALRLGHGTYRIADAVNNARSAMAYPSTNDGLVLANNRRSVRARLALHLRAMLRADAGDDGHRYHCTVCGDTGADWPRGCEPHNMCRWQTVVDVTRIRPLWESAPKTRAR